MHVGSFVKQIKKNAKQTSQPGGLAMTKNMLGTHTKKIIKMGLNCRIFWAFPHMGKVEQNRGGTS